MLSRRKYDRDSFRRPALLRRCRRIQSETGLHPTGLITALATPFDGGGALDLDAWRRLLQWQLAAGVQGVVVAGSTGEAAMLEEGEYDTLLRTAVEQAGGRCRVIAGTGLSGTAATIARTRRAAAAGVDAALVVVPPYVRATQAGLLAHYRAVADQGGLPVILYNVPARSACDLLPETVVQLATHGGIVAIKEAVTDPARIGMLVALSGPRFSVLGGDDATAASSMLAGASGLVSVGSNIAPLAYRRLYELARSGDGGETQAWNARLAPLHAFCGVEPNPIPVKALLRAAGYGQGLRLPLTALAEPYHAEAARMSALAAELEAHCRDQPRAA